MAARQGEGMGDDLDRLIVKDDDPIDTESNVKHTIEEDPIETYSNEADENISSFPSLRRGRREPQLQERGYLNFSRMTTNPLAYVGILTNITMIVLVFLVPILCEKRQRPDASRRFDGEWHNACPFEPFSFLVYSHSCLWLVHIIIDQYLKYKHKISRLKGYIQFYLKTKNIRRTPFYLISIGNAILLITVTVLNDYCDEQHCQDKFTKVDYLRGLMTMETLVTMALWVKYIHNVKLFNKRKMPPDVFRSDFLIKLRVELDDDSLLQNPQSEGDISRDEVFGLQRNPEELRDEVLEKQAELIRYLYKHIQTQNNKMRDWVQHVSNSEHASDVEFGI